MDFSEFKKQIVNVENLELPGEQVHLKMAPIERLLELKKKAREQSNAKKAAVMCLFYPDKDGATYFALILRKTYKGVHSAQIGFPGGKTEPEDANDVETALRETEEEVGVSRSHISVIKKLTEIYIPPSNFFVQPFMGYTATTPHFVPQEEEVEAVIEVPLVEFMNEAIKGSQTLNTSYAKAIEVPAFHLQGHVVWGATAMMLNEVREILKKLL